MKKAIVANVTFEIDSGRSFGIIGLPGSGISTLVHLILRESSPDAGEILLDGRNASQIPMDEFRLMIRHVLCDPRPKLDYSKTFLEILEESSRRGPWESRNKTELAEIAKKIQETLNMRRDPNSKLDWYSNDYDSLRKVELAVALVSAPRLIILGQYLGSSDKEREETLGVLNTTKSTFDLAYILSGGHLARIGQVCDRVATMFLGRIVEIRESVIKEPRHPYSLCLSFFEEKQGAPNKEYLNLASNLSLLHDTPGCPFHPFCPLAMEICTRKEPAMQEIAGNHWVACHLVS